MLARYAAWADELTHEAVAALPPGEAEKERPTLFKTMIGTLNHNYLVISGERGAMTRGEMLLHVVNHKSYHRGWVAEMFFQVPAKLPTTDLPVLLGPADAGAR
jgi:uncharacterized damage-inducible protein DinB